jgi:hypothetical protein
MAMFCRNSTKLEGPLTVNRVQGVVVVMLPWQIAQPVDFQSRQGPLKIPDRLV